MAWNWYYVNISRLNRGPESGEDQSSGKPCIFYNNYIQPNNSVHREWITVGVEHDGAKISFVEYHSYDKDPDGVREDFGCMYDFEYSFTVDVLEADPEKLFVYTLYKDGRVSRGFDIDTDNARSVMVFVEPQNFSDAELAQVIEEAENAPRYAGAVEEIIKEKLLGGRKDTICLAFIRR
ncbi:MAG: hypothetical protein J6S71_01355 [Clostridia bacterium]|nr:hypothetical protein [Clostridia bacterium]